MRYCESLPKKMHNASTWFIGDPHAGHIKLAATRGYDSVGEMNDALIQKWNSVVKPQDKVFVVGDICINRQWLYLWRYFTGRKILIKGNHDIFRLEEYAPYFEDIVASVCFQGFIVTHIPIHPNELERFHCNVHAHTHSKSLDDPRYVCISAEQLDYIPIEQEYLLVKRNS